MRHSPLLFTTFAKLGFALLLVVMVVGVLNSLAAQMLNIDLLALVMSIVASNLKASNEQVRAIFTLFALQCLVFGIAYFGPMVVRWVLGRRIAILVLLLLLAMVDYRLSLLAFGGASVVLFLAWAIYAWLPTRRFGSEGFSHIPIGLRVIHSLGFAVLVLSLLYSPHMKFDLHHELYVLLFTASASYWMVLAILPTLVFGYICYQLGNRFFPLLLSSKWAIGVFVVSLIAAFTTVRSLYVIGLVVGIFIVAFVALELVIPHAGNKKKKGSTKSAYLPWANQLTDNPLERTWNPNHPTH